MVGGKDNDAVIVDAGFLDAVHNPAHTVVHQGQFGIIFGRTLSVGVPHVVQGIDVDEAKFRFFRLDILHAFRYNLFGVLRCVVNAFVVVQAKGIGIVEEVSPFAHHAGAGLRTLLFEHVEEGGLASVLREQDGRKGGMVFIAGNAGKLHGGPVHHGRPVGAADGRTHGAFVQRPGAFLHHGLDKRRLSFFHAPASPAVQADEDDMGGEVRLLGLRLGTGNGEKRRQDNR